MTDKKKLSPLWKDEGKVLPIWQGVEIYVCWENKRYWFVLSDRSYEHTEDYPTQVDAQLAAQKWVESQPFIVALVAERDEARARYAEAIRCARILAEQIMMQQNAQDLRLVANTLQQVEALPSAPAVVSAETHAKLHALATEAADQLVRHTQGTGMQDYPLELQAKIAALAPEKE